MVPTSEAKKLFSITQNFVWKPELIAINLGTCILPTESISAAHYVINGSNITGSQIIG
jgi:hypothetical protein